MGIFVYLLVVLLGLSWAAAGNASERDVPRSYTVLSREVRAALRAEVQAETVSERVAAVRQLAKLYREVVEDPRQAHSELLREKRNRLWSRLTRIRRELEREARRKEASDSELSLASVDRVAAALAEQISVMSWTQGGPAYLMEQAGGAFGGGMVPDHGQELIDLIERTIRPDFWETAGGSGRMFYYRPLMALVVTATTEVHENVAGLLEGMRRVGP